MIKNIIFDIGNVLTDFRWREFLIEKGFSEEMAERIGELTVYSPYWSEYDRGVWTDRQIMDAFISQAPELSAELHLAFDDFHNMITGRDFARDWLLSLKARGFRLYYLSNFSEKAERECMDALNFFDLMDGGILSYKDQLIKPDPRIYELLLGRFGLEASESVFIDDTEKNVEAAERCHIHGIVYREKSQVDAELESLIGKV